MKYWLLLAILVLGGCAKKAASDGGDTGDEAKPTVSVQLATVSYRPIRELVTLNGSFQPAQGTYARLNPAVAGRIANVLVTEGQHVKAGQLLATLDARVQQSQQESASAALQSAQAQTSQSQLSYQAAEADQRASVDNAEIALQEATAQRDSDVHQAQLAYGEAKADLAKARAGARPQEIAQAHEATAQAQATRDRAAAEYRRNESLWPQGYVSKRQLEDSQTALTTAESALVAAQASESLVREGTRPEDLKAAELRTAAARNAAESAIALGDRRVAAAKSALTQAQAALVAVRAKAQEVAANQATARQKAADLSAAAATTELSDIRAPFDGVITRRLLGKGDPADPATPVLEISRSGGGADFLAGALPADAGRIKPGMSASIGDAFTGRVVAVSPADATTGLSTVRITCSGAPTLGAYGTAEVVLSTRAHSMVVPDAALLNRDGKTEVFRDVDGVATATEVAIGPEDHGFTEIQSGLKPTDQVVLLGGFELDDGTKIKPEDAAAKPKEDKD